MTHVKRINYVQFWRKWKFKRNWHKTLPKSEAFRFHSTKSQGWFDFHAATDQHRVREKRPSRNKLPTPIFDCLWLRMKMKIRRQLMCATCAMELLFRDNLIQFAPNNKYLWMDRGRCGCCRLTRSRAPAFRLWAVCDSCANIECVNWCFCFHGLCVVRTNYAGTLENSKQTQCDRFGCCSLDRTSEARSCRTTVQIEVQYETIICLHSNTVPVGLARHIIRKFRRCHRAGPVWHRSIDHECHWGGSETTKPISRSAVQTIWKIIII